ncbi:hypothetical protein KC343_g10956 [Hortaea werneckii]|nr:hypothetical protein KC352_g33980 [Hortaea werneckii]KAI7557185.1 hypothetical protein KC317_g11782 [Hortaea werneckii]KAI7581466.1 hypothetical protein KC346_g18681 [Hortaea werneckii]KAI7613272.1 hypothetical protein KC343_g10956 [Hortaea werneckii]KAI7640023.1 hypothetical protein KC319_g14156 [Hortaea werneckii]
MAAFAGEMSVDFSKFIDPTPLAVHPRLPLETVMELFKKLGPRVILVEHRGRLTGLVTVKDCLKYQFQVEAHENPKDDSGVQKGQEKAWLLLREAAGWFARKVGRYSGGRLQLGAGMTPPPSANSTTGFSERISREEDELGRQVPRATSGEDEGFELGDRRDGL